MAEQLDLTTPIQRINYKVSKLTLDWSGQAIVLIVSGSDGVDITVSWLGAEAVSLMTILNTSNLTTNSLHKRCLNKAVTDGKLPAGNVSGSAS